MPLVVQSDEEGVPNYTPTDLYKAIDMHDDIEVVAIRQDPFQNWDILEDKYMKRPQKSKLITFSRLTSIVTQISCGYKSMKGHRQYLRR